jgi:hypothetical protein
MSWVRKVGVWIVFLFLGAGMASAQADCSMGPFIVLNLAGSSDVIDKAAAFPGGEAALRSLLELYAPPPAPRPPAGQEKLLFSAFNSSLADSNGRWITKKGETIAIYVIHDKSMEKSDPAVEVTETARKTLFATNFGTLVKLAEAIGGFNPAVGFAPGAPPPPPPSTLFVTRQCRTLVNLRSTLVATATADPLSASTTAPKASATVTTGPTEHGFISADLAVNSVKQLQLESNQLVPKDTPSTFYVGFDYMMGDVLAETNTPAESLTVKALIKASSSPLDSLGVAIGTRFKSINAIGFQLDTFSPWAGYIWTKNDTLTGHQYKGDWRVGISLNLDKALGWVQGGSK